MGLRSPLAVVLLVTLALLATAAPVAAAWNTGDCDLCCCGPRPDVSVGSDECPCEITVPSELPPVQPLAGATLVVDWDPADDDRALLPFVSVNAVPTQGTAAPVRARAPCRLLYCALTL